MIQSAISSFSYFHQAVTSAFDIWLNLTAVTLVDVPKSTSVMTFKT